MTDESERSSADEQDVTTEPVRAQYEWSSTAPSTAVIETVAIAVNRAPTTLEPLYESLDPDALDTLLRPTGSASSDVETVTVSFNFADWQVTVHSRGDVIVRANSDER
ncbi:HalOD1 output domain-containing protein [Haloarcula sp. Atlit-120R]|jgi:hypothetical protein|uniref:HalOD1 output domain-containing protein n=1 Tax=Haloarcula sp. Atlit-120R TaxID=2282135 RepID=UPI000EF25395|nr:HalOD1 output domain-containing protein [Haloarcula sp. Atlit-120R]RLM32980.1 hypothetical protein DVK01_18840 [Haloarcula sp. Atlit-120R]